MTESRRDGGGGGGCDGPCAEAWTMCSEAELLQRLPAWAGAPAALDDIARGPLLGEGVVARVHALGTRVAVKIAKSSSSLDLGTLRREAIFMRSAGGPYIIEFFGYQEYLIPSYVMSREAASETGGDSRGAPGALRRRIMTPAAALFMERAETTLHAYILSQELPTPRMWLPLFVQALRGMGELSAAGLVHGDIKGDNILLLRRAGPAEGGVLHARIGDFGLACSVDERAAAHLLCGTGLLYPPRLLAPEVWAAQKMMRDAHATPEQAGRQSEFRRILRGGDLPGHDGRPRSDEFAMGMQLYQYLLRGYPRALPEGLPDEDYEEAALRIARGLCDVHSDVLAAGYPSWLAAVVVGCLEEDPVRRWNATWAAQVIERGLEVEDLVVGVRSVALDTTALDTTH